MAGGGRRFEFGWLEVLGLILAFAGGSAVVFFLGIFVGKGLQESRVRSEEHVVRLPIDGPAEADVRARTPKVAAAPEVAARPLPKPTSAFRLAVKPAPTATKAAQAPRVEPTRVPARVPPRVAATAAPVPVPIRTRAPARPAPTPMATADPRETGTWAVQVNATKDPATADRLIRQLELRGYPAYLFKVRLRGETWYRVRVGRFATMEQATGMVVQLKNKEKYPRAFLVEE
jgi:cell division protein FtsN